MNTKISGLMTAVALIASQVALAGSQQDEDSLYSWGRWASMIQPAAGPAPVEPPAGDLEKIGYNLRPEHAGQFEPQPLASGGGPAEGPAILPIPAEEPAVPPAPPAPEPTPIPGAGPADPTLPTSPALPNPPPPPVGATPIPGSGPADATLPTQPALPNPPPPPPAT